MPLPEVWRGYGFGALIALVVLIVVIIALLVPTPDWVVLVLIGALAVARLT